MSCAVMFQPCMPSEHLTASNAKIDSPPQTLFASPYHFGSMPQSHQQSIYNIQNQHQHYSSMEPQKCQGMKSGRRSPITDEKESGKTVKKLCIAGRNDPVGPNHPPVASSSLAERTQTKEQTPNIGQGQGASHNNEKSNIKYVSANCVVVTHYSGDTSAVVDEHFSRALAVKPAKSSNSGSEFKVSSRNFPASFYQPQVLPRTSLSLGGSFGSSATSDLYEAYHGGFHSIQHHGGDPWAYAFSSQAYSHRGVGHEMYSSSVAPGHAYQYSSLGFPQHFSRIPSVPLTTQMMKNDSWGSRYYDAFGSSADFSGGVDPSSYASASHYHHHNVPGLEAGMVSDTSKEHYWL